MSDMELMAAPAESPAQTILKSSFGIAQA